MSTLTLPQSWVPTRSQIMTTLLAVALLLASAWADSTQTIPFTLQTIPVLLVGFLFPTRQAFVTVMAAVIVIAFTFSAHRVFFTGGYLVGFIVAAAVMGWLMHKMPQQNIFTTAAVGMLGTVTIWFFGAAWLAYGLPQFGISKAWLVGVLPFLLTDIVKLLVTTMVAMKIRPILQSR